MCDKGGGNDANPSGGYGVSTGQSLLMDPLGIHAYTIAHEIGHNFGSFHDGEHRVGSQNFPQFGYNYTAFYAPALGECNGTCKVLLALIFVTIEGKTE